MRQGNEARTENLLNQEFANLGEAWKYFVAKGFLEAILQEKINKHSMWLKCDLQNGLRDSPLFETLGLGFYQLKY